MIRKAFKFITPEQAQTRVIDHVSATIPDQSLSLREMMMRFAYIGSERLEEIVNRGFDGDEDDDILGLDVGALDYAEVHDRVVKVRESSSARAIHAPEPLAPVPDGAPEDTDAPDGAKE